MNLNTLFDEAIDRKASDIHLATGEAPRIRIAGALVGLDQPPLTREALLSLLGPMTSHEARLRLDSGLPIEKSVLHRDIVFSAIVFRVGEEGIVATLRLLSNVISPLEQLGNDALPLLEEIRDSVRGFALISGPTGSGKGTVLYSIVEEINQRRAARIFVVTSSPTFQFSSKEGMVTQFQIGQDCESYARALEICLRSDLDCVALDDIPTPETLRLALILAETGHLVLANLHAEGALDALDRMLNTAGTEAPALRQSLSRNLIAITGQRLFKRPNKSGRVPAYEWLKANEATRQALLLGDMDRLGNLLSQDPDCRSMDVALARLVEEGEITAEQARQG